MPIEIRKAQTMDKESPEITNLKHLLIWRLMWRPEHDGYEFLNLDDVVDWLHDQIDKINLNAQIYHRPPTRETVISWCRQYRRERRLSMFSDGIRVVVTARASLKYSLPPGYVPPKVIR